jgi:integrase
MQPAIYGPRRRRTIIRRASQAGIITALGCHTFRATGITVYLLSGGLLEYAQQMAAHESARTKRLYQHRNDQVTLDQVERIVLSRRPQYSALMLGAYPRSG